MDFITRFRSKLCVEVKITIFSVGVKCVKSLKRLKTPNLFQFATTSLQTSFTDGEI